jgi:hypothetical protein
MKTSDSFGFSFPEKLFQFFIFSIDVIDKWLTTKFEDKKYNYWGK